ncbi:hypothetical protein NDU88_007848 [Pleurodeles waltl]|uniref:Putative nuclease HARBI1 n=1 Tax=Pleurodeles waltl TaxID=8319 RepID=A0AAV7RVY7_PLEWA|nr:hypothetical protein NDU88_007848 [Pleurodeles waltl]
MVVGVVIAHERCVVMGVLVMEVVAEDVVHAGVSGDETGREEGDVEEGDTVEAVDVGMSAWVEDLPTVKGDFYALGHIPKITGAIDGTHVALVSPRRSEQEYRNRKSYHSMNVQMVCLADQYISHVNAKFPGSVHDAYILRNSSSPYVMGQLQSHRVWLIGDSGYPNLSWLLTPVRNPRTRAEERYNEAHGQTRRIIERTFGLLKARFRCLHMTGVSLYYSPKKVCQIIVACCMLHNLALRQVPFLQEDGPAGGLVAAVEPVDSEEEEVEEEDIDDRNNAIQQYFQ